MRKANAAHVTAINNLMLQVTASYIKCNINTEYVATTVADVAHNINALQAFNKNKDCTVLHNSIMLQDTIVREDYIAVLQYIEQNKLVDSYMFVCTV